MSSGCQLLVKERHQLSHQSQDLLHHKLRALDLNTKCHDPSGVSEFTELNTSGLQFVARILHYLVTNRYNTKHIYYIYIRIHKGTW